MSAKDFAERVLAAAEQRDAARARSGSAEALFQPTEHEKQIENLSRAYLEAVKRDA